MSRGLFSDAGHRIRRFFTNLRIHSRRFGSKSRRLHASDSDPRPAPVVNLDSTAAGAPNPAALSPSFVSNTPTASNQLNVEPTPILGGDPQTHGLSPRPNPSSRLMIQTVMHPQQNNNTPSTSNIPHCTGAAPPRDSGSVYSAIETTSRAPRSRALLIGVHYNQHTPEHWETLSTPGEDVKRMRTLLRSRGYTEFRTLVDSMDNERHAMPTEDEIRKGLRWLIKDARSGDKLFLHYSGHGDQVATDDTSESDGHNEAIVPLTLCGAEDTLIIDDELNKILVKPLPHGCALLAVFDCCHSGTMLDLPQRFPQYLTRRNLRAKLIRDLKNRFVHPIRAIKSLPHMRRHHTLTPAPERPAQGHARAPVRRVTRGSINPLHLPYIGGQWFPPESAEHDGGASGSLTPPARLLVDEPQGRSSKSGGSTPQSSMQINLPSEHAVIPTPPPTGQSVETRWVADASLTATPKNNAFDHEQIADTPMVRDFVMHRAYTHIKSPTIEEPAPRATIIAIAACLDEQLAVDADDIGGLLTATFIKCMEEPYHREGVPLGTMISYFKEGFQSKVRNMHTNCSPPQNGVCLCGMPLKAPEPLVTSSMKLMADARIRL